MAPLPSNTTQRIRARYSGPLGTHVMMFRADDSTSIETFMSQVIALIDLFTLLQYDDTTWDTADYAAAGSDIFLPLAGWSAIVGASGSDPGANQGKGRFLEFGGRSSGGRRVKYYLFETFAQEVPDYRYETGEFVAVDDVVSYLQDEDTLLTAIDGLTVSWYSYANVGDNDYWVHQARRS